MKLLPNFTRHNLIKQTKTLVWKAKSELSLFKIVTPINNLFVLESKDRKVTDYRYTPLMKK